MNKEVGRNDPCPCGSGKKYKKCCELRLSQRRFSASILSGANLLNKASQVSTHIFNKNAQPTLPEPHHPPEADKPM